MILEGFYKYLPQKCSSERENSDKPLDVDEAVEFADADSRVVSP